MNFHSLLRRSIFFPNSLSLTVLCSAFLELSFFLPFFHCSTEHFILTLWARFFLLPPHNFFYILQQHDIRPEKSKNDTKLASEENFSSFKLSCMLAAAVFCWLWRREKEANLHQRNLWWSEHKKSNFIRCCFILGNVSLQTLLRHRLDFCRSFRFFVDAFAVVVDPILTEIFFNFFRVELSNALFCYNSTNKVKHDLSKLQAEHETFIKWEKKV